MVRRADYDRIDVLVRQDAENGDCPRMKAHRAEVERARDAGELPADVDPELVVDAISGPLYYRLLMRREPLTEAYADDLVAQAFRC